MITTALIVLELAASFFGIIAVAAAFGLLAKKLSGRE